jgi:hypothetical protein
MKRIFVLLALLLVTASCSKAAEPTTTSTTSLSAMSTTGTSTATTAPTTTAGTSTTTTAYAGPVSPLNGMPVDAPVERRTLAVKIDNHPAARPQSGIQEADAVIELPVEGVTRFMALFNANDSTYLGPIRSVRPTDIALSKPLGGNLVVSGGSFWILRYVRAHGAHLITNTSTAHNTGGMFRIDSRTAPHNLYGDTTGIRAYADDLGIPDTPPPNLFEWGPLQPDGTSNELTLYWAPRTVWTWDGEHYTRTSDGVPHEWVAEDGTRGQIAVDTLVVILARRYTANPPKPSDGKAVPAMDVVGSGKALVFAGGEYAEGTWSRNSEDEPFTLTRPDGSALTVPPGKLWVSIYPNSLEIDR